MTDTRAEVRIFLYCDDGAVVGRRLSLARLMVSYCVTRIAKAVVQRRREGSTNAEQRAESGMVAGDGANRDQGEEEGMEVCKRQGCDRPVHVEKDGKKHPFCGRGCADAWMLAEPGPRCGLPGCEKVCHFREGKWLEYCGIRHAKDDKKRRG